MLQIVLTFLFLTNFLLSFQGAYESLNMFIPIITRFLSNYDSLEFFERLFGTLSNNTLIEIGLVRRELLETTSLKPLVEKFENALMAKLDLGNIHKQRNVWVLTTQGRGTKIPHLILPKQILKWKKSPA